MKAEFEFRALVGSEILNYVEEIASFRIRYFKDFPYLYSGNLAYEAAYLKGYSNDERSLLILVTNQDGNLVGVSTSLPLSTNSSILDGTGELFKRCGFNPAEYFYYGEIILDYSIRGKGLSRQILEIQDRYSISRGFTKVTLATVVRESSDVRMPDMYSSTDEIWTKLGYELTQIKFEYAWPTIQKDGSVLEQLNPMVYWVKKLI